VGFVLALKRLKSMQQPPGSARVVADALAPFGFDAVALGMATAVLNRCLGVP
jgi:hypothetical protein